MRCIVCGEGGGFIVSKGWTTENREDVCGGRGGGQVQGFERRLRGITGGDKGNGRGRPDRGAIGGRGGRRSDCRIVWDFRRAAGRGYRRRRY